MYECALDSRINNKKLQIISNSQKRRIKELLCFTYIINIFRLNGFFIAIDFQEYHLRYDLKCPKICHIKILKAFHKQSVKRSYDNWYKNYPYLDLLQNISYTSNYDLMRFLSYLILLISGQHIQTSLLSYVRSYCQEKG